MTSSTKRRLLIDLETYSSVDITKAGAFKYVESDDFEIMLLAYAWDDEPVRMLDLLDPNGHDEMPDIMSGILDPNIVKVAHNSAFERACLTRYLGRDLPPEEWEDTMILAAMNGLPLSLEAAGAALELRDQKIREGTALISYFCKPCKPTIANGGVRLQTAGGRGTGRSTRRTSGSGSRLTARETWRSSRPSTGGCGASP